MERLIGEAVRLISHRENSMTRSRSGDFAAYFTSRGDARPEDPYGHFYLVVDRIDALFARYPRFEQPIRQILAAGGAVGVHIIASATSLRYTLESSFAKIYLTCNADDLLISDRDHRDAVKSIPSGRPGRTIALDAPWHPACVFTSDAGELPTPKTVGASKAPSVWPVADRLPADALPSPAPGRIAIGLNRHTGLPANLPWPTDLIVAGAGRSGRSNIVRMIINHIAESQTAEQLRVFIADPKLTLRQEARELRSAGFLDPATGYAYDRSSAHSMIDTITEHFNSSHTSTHYSVLDEPDRSAVRTGPHVLVLIDDYSRFTDDSFTLKSEFDRLSEHLGPRTGGLSVIVTITDREWTSFKDSYAALPAAMMNQQTPLLALSGSPANTVRPTIGEDEAVKFTSRRAGTCMLMQPPSGCAELPVVQTPIHPPAAERAASTSSQPRT
jgi:S-DNA-T family DNA segregation ATPase FtsK/SpoIIIE